jgi:heat shock protein HslJ
MESTNPGFRTLLAAVALTTLAACAMQTPPEVANATSAPLTDSQWRLTRLEREQVQNPPGARQIYFVLQPQNTGVNGFSGCNRMFGRYALEGESLKFDGMGGTRMACVDENVMKVEQRYLAMFAAVARWKISDRELQLLDPAGQELAAFEAQPANSQPGAPGG